MLGQGKMETVQLEGMVAVEEDVLVTVAATKVTAPQLVEDAGQEWGVGCGLKIFL